MDVGIGVYDEAGNAIIPQYDEAGNLLPPPARTTPSAPPTILYDEWGSQFVISDTGVHDGAGNLLAHPATTLWILDPASGNFLTRDGLHRATNAAGDSVPEKVEASESEGKADSIELPPEAAALAANLSEAKELKARAPYPHLKSRSDYYKGEEVTGSPDTERHLNQFLEAAEKQLGETKEEDKPPTFKALTPEQQLRVLHRNYVVKNLAWTKDEYNEYVDDSCKLIPGKIKVKYLKEDDRSRYELYYDSALHQGDPEQKTEKKFTTAGMQAKMKGKDWGIYVMDPQGHVYAEGHKPGLFHHSSFLAGGDVAGAGELKVDKEGKLEHITNKTGHYQAGPENLSQAIQEFERMGISPSSYKVSEVKLLSGDKDAKIHPGDGDLPASQWQDRYLKTTAEV
jgi:hypothetical protein